MNEANSLTTDNNNNTFILILTISNKGQSFMYSRIVHLPRNLFIVSWFLILSQRAVTVRSFQLYRPFSTAIVHPIISMAPARFSPRRRTLTSAKEDEAADTTVKELPKKKAAKVVKTKKVTAKATITTKSPRGSTAKTTQVETTPKKQKLSAESALDDSPPKKVKAPKHQVVTTRDPIPKLWNEDRAAENNSYSTSRQHLHRLMGFIASFPFSFCV